MQYDLYPYAKGKCPMKTDTQGECHVTREAETGATLEGKVEKHP